MVEVRLENVRKVFNTRSGQETAVEGMDLTIEDGEFFTFVGPSGCGKTTTLRMIAGLETPTSGEIYFDGERVTDLSPQDRDVAMVFQNIVLYPHLTNYENIGYGLKVRGETDNYDEKIREAAEMLGISETLDKKPSQLSGGQQQRVALGRAIVRDPNVILFDEPMSDLDAQLKAELRVEIQRLHQEIGTTFVYVTHDQEEALTMSDRIGIMSDGELAQVGRPDVIFDQPANEFVSQFIGQPGMNVIDAYLDRDEQLVIHETTIDADFNGVADNLVGLEGESKKPVRIGFRPQNAELTTDLKESFLIATVDVWETAGNYYLVYMTDEQDNLIVVTSRDTSQIESGVEIGICHVEDLYLFHPKTGDSVGVIEDFST